MSLYMRTFWLVWYFVGLFVSRRIFLCGWTFTLSFCWEISELFFIYFLIFIPNNIFNNFHFYSILRIFILEELLAQLTNDKYDNIAYYMWEIDFGKEYVDGMITDEQGNNMPLSNAEELYDLIMSSQD